jgi:von Willebrand factor A domain-containing protein 7
VTASGPCGAPSLSGQVSNIMQSGTTVTATLTLTNTGFTAAQAVNINQMTFHTLSGSGTVTLASPSIPAAGGPLAIGGSITVPVTLNVPVTVTRFSITEGGNLTAGAGNSYNYSLAQTIVP